MRHALILGCAFFALAAQIVWAQDEGESEGEITSEGEIASEGEGHEGEAASAHDAHGGSNATTISSSLAFPGGAIEELDIKTFTSAFKLAMSNALTEICTGHACAHIDMDNKISEVEYTKDAVKSVESTSKFAGDDSNGDACENRIALKERSDRQCGVKCNADHIGGAVGGAVGIDSEPVSSGVLQCLAGQYAPQNEIECFPICKTPGYKITNGTCHCVNDGRTLNICTHGQYCLPNGDCHTGRRLQTDASCAPKNAADDAICAAAAASDAQILREVCLDIGKRSCAPWNGDDAPTIAKCAETESSDSAAWKQTCEEIGKCTCKAKVDGNQLHTDKCEAITASSTETLEEVCTAFLDMQESICKYGCTDHGTCRYRGDRNSRCTYNPGADGPDLDAVDTDAGADVGTDAGADSDADAGGEADGEPTEVGEHEPVLFHEQEVYHCEMFSPDKIQVTGIAPGSVVVSFTMKAWDTQLDEYLNTLSMLVDSGKDIPVQALKANATYMSPPLVLDGCVPVRCQHDEHHCVPQTCEQKECYPVPCSFCNAVDDHDTDAVTKCTAVHAEFADAATGGGDTEEYATRCKATAVGQGCKFELANCFTIANPGYESTKVMCAEAPCVPVTCDHGDKDCVQITCGEHGGHHSDPCEQGHHGDDGLAFWPFLLAGLLIAIMYTTCLTKLANGACCGKSLNPPFTVLMFFTGYFLSEWVSHEHFVGDTLKDVADSSHILIDSVDAWKGAHPHVILFCLLPPLLFEDAASMEFYTFRKVLMSSILLAGPGVALTMGMCAATTMILFGFEQECMKPADMDANYWMLVHEPELIDGPADVEVCRDSLPTPVHLLLGGMLAATDPVAVCAVLNSLGCPDKLNYMIAGESLLNDGTAVVAFLVMQSVAGGCGTDAAHVLLALVRLAGGGVLWGLFMAMLCFNFTKHVRNPAIEISTVLVCTMFTFWYAENVAGVSGVLGTVVFGVQTARTSLLAMDEDSHHASHAFWSEVGYIATAMIFLVAGVKSFDKIVRFLDEATTTLNTDDGEFHVANQMTMNIVLWIILTGIRAGVVFAFAPILTKIGYGLTWKEAVVMVWGGLRGAVSLSLALLVDGNHLINERSRELIFMQTVGIVSLTLLVNGSTSGMVYKALNVYPQNPFRPMLATQGLRNLQIEMEKVRHKMKGHWFHGNADTATLDALMPNFGEAHLYDGDLVDVEIVDAHTAWMEGISAAERISPQRAILKSAITARDAMKTAAGLMRVAYSSKERMEHHKEAHEKALEPDAYAEIGVAQGDFWDYGQTDCVQKTKDPMWTTDNKVSITVLKKKGVEGAAFIYVHMFDNDFGDDDDYIGEGKLNISELLEKPPEEANEYTLDLTLCTHLVKNVEHKREMPTKVNGNITIQVAVSDVPDGKQVSIMLISGENLGTESAGAGSSHDAGQGEEHHEGDGHGHGHGGHDTVLMLQNVRRWIIEADKEGPAMEKLTKIDKLKLPEFATYEILIAHMKHHFHHAREEDTLSLSAMSRLYSACGIAFDINNANLESIGRRAYDSKGVTETDFDAPGPEMLNPMVAAADHIEQYVDGVIDGKFCVDRDASDFFQHRVVCMEVLFAFIEQLRAVGDVEKVGDNFTEAVGDALERLEKKLAEMQLKSPNTCKAVHTLIAFRVHIAEFQHRLHSYGEQGFFADTYVQVTDDALISRKREIDQYMHIDLFPSLLGMISFNLFNSDHPVVSSFAKDSKEIKEAAAIAKAENPLEEAGVEMEEYKEMIKPKPLNEENKIMLAKVPKTIEPGVGHVKVMSPDGKNMFPVVCPEDAKAGDTIAVEYELRRQAVPVNASVGQPMDLVLAGGLTATIKVPAGLSGGADFELMVPTERVIVCTWKTKKRPKGDIET
jgi:NhaP-type Na+/H+ or K+/H+ antiporter